MLVALVLVALMLVAFVVTFDVELSGDIVALVVVKFEELELSLPLVVVIISPVDEVEFVSYNLLPTSKSFSLRSSSLKLSF